MKNSALKVLVLVTVVITMMTSMVSYAGELVDPFDKESYTNKPGYNNSNGELSADTQVTGVEDLYRVGDTAKFTITAMNNGNGDKKNNKNINVAVAIYDEDDSLIMSNPDVIGDLWGSNLTPGEAGETVILEVEYLITEDMKGRTVELPYAVFDYGKGMKYEDTSTSPSLKVKIEGWSETMIAQGVVELKVADYKEVTVAPKIYELKNFGTPDEKLKKNPAVGTVLVYADGEPLDYDAPDFDKIVKELPVGTVLTFEAVPGRGYRFLNWKYNYINYLQAGMDGYKPNPRTVTVTKKDTKFSPSPVFIEDSILPLEWHELTLTYLLLDRDPEADRVWSVFHNDQIPVYYPVKLGYMVDGGDLMVIDEALEFDNDAINYFTGTKVFDFTTENPVGVEAVEHVELFWWNSFLQLWIPAGPTGTNVSTPLYQVDYDANGGSFPEGTAGVVTEGGSEHYYQYGYAGVDPKDVGVEPGNPTREGFTFEGWDNPSDIDISAIDKSGVLTAQWKEDYNFWSSADDKADVYMDGEYLDRISTYNTATKMWVTLDSDYEDDHLIAAKAWDRSGTANIAGFKAVLEEEGGDYNSTGESWWVYYDPDGEAPADDSKGNDWNDRGYMSDDWVPVTSFTLAEAPTPRNWTADSEFPDAEAEWIWNENFNVPNADNNDKIDTPVYLRSMEPADVVWTVSFDANDGSGAPDDQTVKDGEKAVEPTQEPTRDGYEFDGWYLDGRAYLFENETEGVTEDIELTAKWEKIPGPWTVSFEADEADAGSVMPDDQTVNNGEKATEPGESEEPSRTGYSFVGWFEVLDTGAVSDTAYDFDTLVTEDKVLKVGWEQILWNVSFDANGGTGAPATLQVADGGTVAEPTSEPTREGYDFIEWQLDSSKFEFEGSSVTANTVTAHITLVAKWQVEEVLPVYHTVTYVPNNGDASTVEQVLDGSSAREWTPDKEFYDFVEWQENGTAYGFGAVTSDVVLEAVWELESYAVTFDADGGVEEPADQDVTRNEKATEPADPAKDGYTFLGWFEDYGNDDGVAESAFDFDTLITGPVDLVAKWEAVVIPPAETEAPVDPTDAPEETTEATTAEKKGTTTKVAAVTTAAEVIPVTDAPVPEASVPSSATVAEAAVPMTTAELKDLDEIEVPEAGLPQTGGLPIPAFAGIGMAIVGLGLKLKRRG